MVKVLVAYTHGIPYKKEIQSAMLSKSLLNRCLYGDVIVDNSLRNATSPRKRYSQTETQEHSCYCRPELDPNKRRREVLHEGGAYLLPNNSNQQVSQSGNEELFVMIIIFSF
jgi:hypothetical protein